MNRTQAHPHKQAFTAATMRAAIHMIQEEFGSDAIILSTHKVPQGIQIEAAPNPARAPKDITITQKFTELRSADNTANNADHTLLKNLQSELSLLRQLVENQSPVQPIAAPASASPTTNAPTTLQNKLLTYLLEHGFDASYCQNIVEQIGAQQNFDHALNEAAKLIIQDTATTGFDLIDYQGAIALVGPTGVGKTTTLAKLAARFTLRYSRDDIALISSDFYRVAGREQLRIYGKILDIPIHLVNNIQDLDDALEQLKDKRLILIDTAGVSPSDVRLTQKMNLITQSKRALSTFLVFSATSQAGVIKQAVDAFRSDQLKGAIITKLDESTQVGQSLSVCISEQLPIAYLSNGQNVPEDLKLARAQDLVKHALALETKIKELTHG